MSQIVFNIFAERSLCALCSSCTDAISNNLIKDRSSLFRHLNSERVKPRPEKKLRNKKGGRTIDETARPRSDINFHIKSFLLPVCLYLFTKMIANDFSKRGLSIDSLRSNNLQPRANGISILAKSALTNGEMDRKKGSAS